MTVLRSIETKRESLFEGVFGRAFRANVQPVELARKLVKEMDEHRNVSVSRVYVPDEYTIYLSAADREQFSDYEDSLRDELQEYLATHARRESYVLLSPPRVKFETDRDLDLGVFGIATRLTHTTRPRQADAPPAQPEPGATMIYAPQPPAATEPAGPSAGAVLIFGGIHHPIAVPRAVLGRSKDCDIQVADPNVSRRHPEIPLQRSPSTLADPH